MPAPRSFARRVPGVGRVLDRIGAAIAWRVDQRVGATEQWLRDVDERSAWTANEMARIAPQVAALEVRLANLDERLGDGALEQPARDDARSALDQIRAEHERVRVRLQAVSQYEERLRRLEDAPASHGAQPS